MSTSQSSFEPIPMEEESTEPIPMDEEEPKEADESSTASEREPPKELFPPVDGEPKEPPPSAEEPHKPKVPPKDEEAMAPLMGEEQTKPLDVQSHNDDGQKTKLERQSVSLRNSAKDTKPKQADGDKAPTIPSEEPQTDPVEATQMEAIPEPSEQLPSQGMPQKTTDNKERQLEPTTDDKEKQLETNGFGPSEQPLGATKPLETNPDTNSGPLATNPEPTDESEPNDETKPRGSNLSDDDMQIETTDDEDFRITTTADDGDFL